MSLSSSASDAIVRAGQLMLNGSLSEWNPRGNEPLTILAVHTSGRIHERMAGMNDVVLSLPLTDVERRTLAMLGSLHPEDDDGMALALLASRVETLRNAGGLGVCVSTEVVRGLAIAEDILCLLLASRPAREKQSLIERARLFSRHRGRPGSRVGLFVSSALEADRRRLGLRKKDLGA